MRINKAISVILISISLINSNQGICQETSKTIGFEIKVDPRIELMNVVLTFTKWPYYGKIDEPHYDFLNEMKKYFSPYQNHETVMWCNDFPFFQDISFPAAMMIHLTDPPNMEVKYDVLDRFSEEEKSSLLKTVDLLNQFAEDSRFMNFWKINQPFYEKLVYDIKGRLPFDKYLNIVTDFYGESSTDFKCIITPTLHGVGFGPTLVTEKVKIPHFVAGPDKFDHGNPIFTDEWLRLLIFHEFGHAYVNPLCEKHWDEISEYEHLLQYFNSSSYISNNYNEWFVVVHEHIVRSCEYILLKKAGLIDESELNIKKNLDYGFTLIPHYIQKLEYYDKHRDQYPTFESYFKELIKVFDEVSLDELKNTEDIDETEQPQLENKNQQDADITHTVDSFFKLFNEKDTKALKNLLHSKIIVSKYEGDAAIQILEAAVSQLSNIDEYKILKITNDGEKFEVTGKYNYSGEENDFTFLINSNGKFLDINMFSVNSK
ncbi:MAG: DUF4932 domain-containing protein [Bacteroidales bacterium]|nr:DUF4932 domain-containing protein [Bacteroidales bacterium]